MSVTPMLRSPCAHIARTTSCRPKSAARSRRSALAHRLRLLACLTALACAALPGRFAEGSSEVTAEEIRESSSLGSAAIGEAPVITFWDYDETPTLFIFEGNVDHDYPLSLVFTFGGMLEGTNGSLDVETNGSFTYTVSLAPGLDDEATVTVTVPKTGQYDTASVQVETN